MEGRITDEQVVNEAAQSPPVGAGVVAVVVVVHLGRDDVRRAAQTKSALASAHVPASQAEVRQLERVVVVDQHVLHL